MDANPYFAGSPKTPYIANLLDGAAIAGIVPGLSASAILEGLDIPANAVGAIVFTAIDFPPLLYNSSNATALLYLNLSGAALRNMKMGAGEANYSAALKQFGWVKDPRFGGIGATSLMELPADAVYATLTAGQLDELDNLSASATSAGVSAVRNNQVIQLDEVLFLLLGSPSCLGDLNHDGYVDDSDFALFSRDYNLMLCEDAAMPTGCPADLNGDGFVDDADFSVFVVAYNAKICE